MGLLDAGQVRRILYEALDLWSRHANISFRETYSTEADIQVMFARKFHGDGYNFDGPGKILAHAFYPGTGIGGDAHFDEEESWLLNEPLDAEGKSKVQERYPCRKRGPYSFLCFTFFRHRNATV